MTTKQDLQKALTLAQGETLKAKEVYAAAREQERSADSALAEYIARENHNIERGDTIVYKKGKGEGRIAADDFETGYNESVEISGHILLKSGEPGERTEKITVGDRFSCWHTFIRVEKKTK